ncbi:type II toxin-antitoxin system RelE/ParE family toxin [Mesorhizobium australafricanum]|uniref:Type II toxin-antitoxin system RelE/ParE family toxin n=1 Tax=Mesorhizobium australafricanum TaxID=3072311 RepID=A0ABU4WW35_9HYPH|nr:type II toxin-antitoxin system RelE/ParE family toxin [Mesorhizobium sp. VK3E]MDX8439984.1 type II toxin-antitoxin system RelE/ParE family toxin [Mesorhizobium sp. VK3E]
MIKSFKNKALADLFETGKTGKIDVKMRRRILARLDTLNEAVGLDDLKMPGYDFHALRGFNPTRYTIHVNGPWCITFEFDGRDAFRVDFEQYH